MNINSVALESSARSYSVSIPDTFVSGRGSYLYTQNNKRFLDFLTGAGVMLLGHNHPNLADAMAKAHLPVLSSLDLNTADRTLFLERFSEIVPRLGSHEPKVHFCGPTGSDAIEALLKLAKTATGRSGVFCFSGSYHGMTQGALGVSSSLRARENGLRAKADVTFCHFPYPFRGVGPLDEEANATSFALSHIETLLSDDHSGVEKPGVILLECIQGEGGNVVAPYDFLTGLRRICDTYGILLAIDEIQSGLGRTGKWFAFEHYDVAPDLFVVSKGIGGGIPLSLLVYRSDLDCWESGAHIGTFRGQGLAFRLGAELIRTIRSDHILDNVENMGQLMTDGLNELVSKHSAAGQVRGMGLFLGLECRNTENLSAGKVAGLVRDRLYQNGILIETGGRENAVLRFLPPLTIDKSEIQETLAALEGAFVSVGGAPNVHE